MKHQLTQKQALAAARHIWKYLSETGKDKTDSMNQRYLAGCPLCEFHLAQNINDTACTDPEALYYRTGCLDCKLGTKELCLFAQRGSVFTNWDNAIDKEEKIKFAKIIYEVLS